MKWRVVALVVLVSGAVGSYALDARELSAAFGGAAIMLATKLARNGKEGT